MLGELGVHDFKPEGMSVAWRGAYEEWGSCGGTGESGMSGVLIKLPHRELRTGHPAGFQQGGHFAHNVRIARGHVGGFAGIGGEIEEYHQPQKRNLSK